MTKKTAITEQAAKTAQTVPPLLLAAEKVAHAVMGGEHGRKKSGHGDTFWQFRAYQAGDEPRRINWRKSAQTGDILVRETEWATAQSVFFWRDTSLSMQFHSKPRLPTKQARADLLLMACAHVLARGGERLALLNHHAHPASGKTALESMALQMMKTKTGTSHFPKDPVLSKNAHVLLFGDFLSPPKTLKPFLAKLATHGAKVLLVQILDPAEIRFPYKGHLLVKGCEGEAPLLLPNARQIRDSYRKRLAAHQAALRELARQFGFSFLVHDTSHSPRQGLMDIYRTLMQGHDR